MLDRAFGSSVLRRTGCRPHPERQSGRRFTADVYSAHLVHPGHTPTTGESAIVGPGIQLTAVPALPAGQTLVGDTSGLCLVLRSDFEAETSEHAGFRNDQAVLRVKGRFACAAPTSAKFLRLIVSAN